MVMFAVLLAWLAGCADSASPSSMANLGGVTPTASPPAAPPLRLATFNAALLPGVATHPRERAVAIAARLPSLELDGLCLQEVWIEDDWRRISAALAERLPHAIRPRASSEACTPEEASAIEACERRSCAAAEGEARTECLVAHCSRVAASLSRGCLARLLEGSSGLAFATRVRVLADEVLELESAFEPRAVIHARLADPDLHVFCTHLTAPIALPGRPRESAEAEQDRQIDRLLDWIDERTRDGAPVVLLGDLNTGPAAGAGVVGRVSERYARIVARGFVSPYLTGSAPSCTFCSDNPLVGGGRIGGVVIDHALVRGWTSGSSAVRILDEPVPLVVGGTEISSRYADHYGILLTLER